MKKRFCFYCQKDVKPQRVLLWQVCEQCHRRLTDNGEGFYKVCGNCGSNMSVEANQCVQCGFRWQNSTKRTVNWPELMFKYGWIINFLASILLILIFVGLIYVSFYIFIFLAVFIALSYVFSMFRRG